MLPSIIPLFPLPGVVLFPTVSLPLHVFEPRYRALLSHALEGDRIIGMALLRPGWEGDYEGRPPVYAIGCAGLITHAEPLPDGRSNIVLRGFEKFRILREHDRRPFRMAEVEAMPEVTTPQDREILRAERRRIEELIVPARADGGDRRMPPAIADEDLVNALAQYLDFETVERQALLERDGVLSRCRSLIDLLEMRGLGAKREWGGGN